MHTLQFAWQAGWRQGSTSQYGTILSTASLMEALLQATWLSSAKGLMTNNG
jgi:hypothetical protein